MSPMYDSPNTILEPDSDMVSVMSKMRKKSRMKIDKMPIRKMAAMNKIPKNPDRVGDMADEMVDEASLTDEDKRYRDQGLWKTKKGLEDLKSRVRRAKGE